MVFEKGQKVGEGSYGLVYFSISPKTGTNYAVKTCLKEKDVDFTSTWREANLLRIFKDHPNIVKLERSYVGKDPFEKNNPLSPICQKSHNGQIPDNIHFAFPRAEMDLFSFIYQDQHKNITNFLELQRIAFEILVGVDFMHKSKIIHRDLKPSNVLLYPHKDSSGYNAKICDFGLANFYTQQASKTPDLVTCWYRAPEICMKNPFYDTKVDIWSTGCIIFELFAKKAFIYKIDDDNKKLLHAILYALPTSLDVNDRNLVLKNTWDKYSSDYTNSLPFFKKITRRSFIQKMNIVEQKQYRQQLGDMKILDDLLNKMIIFNPNKRWSSQQCLQHPFFNNLTYSYQNVINLPPIKFQNCIKFVNCYDRIHMVAQAREIFTNNRRYKQWYSHRILFHTIQIFDLFLIDTVNHLTPKEECNGLPRYLQKEIVHIAFFTCLYMFIKFFCSINLIGGFRSVTPPEYCNPKDLEKAEKIEQYIFFTLQNYELYQETLYEAADNINKILTYEEVGKLLHYYCSKAENGESNSIALTKALAIDNSR